MSSFLQGSNQLIFLDRLFPVSGVPNVNVYILASCRKLRKFTLFSTVTARRINNLVPSCKLPLR